MNKEAEQMLGQIQMQNQQLQILMLQRQALEVQSKEIENALAEIEKLDKEDIYRSIGPVLVKTDKKNVKDELTEQQEEAGLKLKAVEKQEKAVRERMQKSQKELQDIMGSGE